MDDIVTGSVVRPEQERLSTVLIVASYGWREPPRFYASRTVRKVLHFVTTELQPQPDFKSAKQLDFLAMAVFITESTVREWKLTKKITWNLFFSSFFRANAYQINIYCIFIGKI